MLQWVVCTLLMFFWREGGGGGGLGRDKKVMMNAFCQEVNHRSSTNTV